MRIGELARLTGATPRSLRHYEAVGLIQSTRLANGYRNYDVNQITQVSTIRELLTAGLSLAAIAEIAPCHSAGRIPPQCQVARARIDSEIARLDKRAAELAIARRRLGSLKETAGRTTGPGSPLHSG